MLILSRKVGERIYIGDDIVITVLEITPANDRRKIRLGIEAPRDMAVLRSELAIETDADEGQTN